MYFEITYTGTEGKFTVDVYAATEFSALKDFHADFDEECPTNISVKISNA